MKKVLFLIVSIVILGLVFTGCGGITNITAPGTTTTGGMTYLTKGGPTIDNAEEFPLYAGQDNLVGQVLVWDDGTQLCVKYQLSEEALAEGWLLYETHLAVGHVVGDISQTKKNNPIPGQFPYGDDDLGGVEFYQECISFGDLDVDCNELLVIAAHAVIEKCVTVQDTLVPELTWARSSESGVAVYPGYGAQWTQEQGFAILTPDAFVWDGGTAGQYFTGYSSRNDISWASWICTQNQSGKSLTGTDLRRFNATFEIPAGYNVTGATLGSVNSGYENVIPMNDNIYIFMNQELIFWGGTISIAQLDPTRTEFLSITRRDTEPQDKTVFPETDGWHMAGTFPVVPSGLFVEGANNLDVFAEELWTGGGMHELGLTLQVEQTTCESETAWAGTGEGTIQFEGKNWATYFEYTTIECPPCMETDGELTITGTGWKSVGAWCPCAYKYDLDAMEIVALKGSVDLSEAAVANTGDWSKYYAMFSMTDSYNHTVQVTFNNDWLGTWYEIPPSPWDRIRMENNMGLAQPQQYYTTVGGVLGYDMAGTWVGEVNGATVYPSDENYFFQLIADPSAQTFTLQVYGMGSSAPDNPPADWPKQNMFDEPKWLEIGTINVGSDFDFTEISICAKLWASTQAGPSETSTITWEGMEIGAPDTW